MARSVGRRTRLRLHARLLLCWNRHGLPPPCFLGSGLTEPWASRKRLASWPGATTDFKGALGLLLDCLAVAGLLQRDGTTIKRASGARVQGEREPLPPPPPPPPPPPGYERRCLSILVRGTATAGDAVMYAR